MISPKDKLLEDFQKYWRVESIYKPILPCLKSLRGFSFCYEETFPDPKDYKEMQKHLIPIGVMPLFEQGFDPRVIEVPDFAKRMSTYFVPEGHRFATFTIRATHYQNARNSDIKVFEDCARYLITKGVVPILIFDSDPTSDIELTIDPSLWLVCDAARYNLLARLGLYSRAVTNISTGGGPAHCLWYSELPFISTLVPDLSVNVTDPAWFPRFHGIPYGSQYPWFSRSQRFIFGPESSDLIISEMAKQGI